MRRVDRLLFLRQCLILDLQKIRRVLNPVYQGSYMIFLSYGAVFWNHHLKRLILCESITLLCYCQIMNDTSHGACTYCTFKARVEDAAGSLFSIEAGKFWRLRNGRIFYVKNPEDFANLSTEEKLDETVILQNQGLWTPAEEMLEESDVDHIFNVLKSAYERLP